jgi:type IV pilus assembly protein PilV
MVGLQASALQNNREARLQSVAVNLARELAEMMRGNKDIAMLATDNPYLGDFSGNALTASTSNCLSVGSSCANTGAVAAAELSDWLSRVDTNLPRPRVTICRDSAPYDGSGLPRWPCTATAGDVIVVKIGWSRLSTNASTQDRTIKATGTSTGNRPAVILPVTAGSTT